MKELDSVPKSPKRGLVYAIRRWIGKKLKFGPKERSDTSGNLEVSLIKGGKHINFNGGNIEFHVNSHNVTGPRITGITLVDAAGMEYNVPRHLAMTYETFMKALELFMGGSVMEARMQRWFISRGLFDLCVDTGTINILIKGEDDWGLVEPGTRVLMRVVVLQSRRQKVYQCPRCGVHNECLSGNKSINCKGCYGRFQFSESEDDKENQSDANDYDLRLLRNFHVKQVGFNLARTYFDKSRRNKDREFQPALPKTRRRRDHPDTLSIGSMYSRQGSWNKAETLLVTEIMERLQREDRAATPSLIDHLLATTRGRPPGRQLTYQDRPNTKPSFAHLPPLASH